MLNFEIYTPYFLYYTWCLLVLKFVCRFNLSELECMTRGVICETLLIEEANKRGQRYPTRSNRAKYHRWSQCIETQCSRSGGTTIEETTTGWQWGLPRTLMAITVRPWWLSWQWQLPLP